MYSEGNILISVFKNCESMNFEFLKFNLIDNKFTRFEVKQLISYVLVGSWLYF